MLPPFPLHLSCSCRITPDTTPFGLFPAATKAAGAPGYDRYCFSTYVVTAPTTYRECGNTTNFLKAEIWINETLYRRSIGNIYLYPSIGANATRAPSWGKPGEGTLKATPINWSPAQADGGKICFDVKAGLDIYDVCLGNDNGNFGW